MDFGPLQRHGIYRDIPVRYRRVVSPTVPIPAGRVRYDLDLHRVTDAAGRELLTDVSGSSSVRIRIGDPNVFVTGAQTYVIYYSLSGGLGFFDTFDELYWQVTGTAWPVPIERASARVQLPGAARAFADSAPWQAHCYAGSAESTSDAGCTATVVASGAFAFATTEPLGPGEGLTLAAGFPKGVIAGPTRANRLLDKVLRYGPLALPLLALGLLLAWWRRHGREPEMGSIAPQWRAPEGLRPGTAGALADQRADMDDVIATVLDLAVRGWLTLREVPPEGILGGVEESSLAGRALKSLGLRKPDWELVRRPQDTAELEPYERLILDGMLEGEPARRLSALRNKFYAKLPDIKKGLYQELVKQKYFSRSPATTRNYWLVGGVVMLLLALAAGIPALSLGIWSLLPALILCGILVIVFSFHMPAMTAGGARVRRDLEGLREYIRRAEKAEIEFHDAPEKTPELFSALLPFAVALNVSELWVKQFAGLLQRPPDWYVGTGVGWNAASFQSGLNGFQQTASSSLASSPGGSSGSGGGGSVGGGGGGGGGGSW